MATDTVLISHVVGKAWMRASDGTLVALREGMRVPADAHILTEEGASVTLQADGTPPVVIGENTDMVVTDDIAAAQPQPAEHAVTPPTADVAGQVLAALQAGEDPFEILDPTAAVLFGGEGGGFNFTRLASVLETTSPLGLAYPRPGVETPEFVQLGGVAATADDTAAPVPAGPTINVPDINDIPGGDEQAPVTVPGNFTISETDTETGIVGTFSFSAAGGLQALIFNFSGETGTSGGAAAPADAAPRTVTLSDLQASATMPIEIDTDRGLLIINGYNTETGEVSYRYVSDGWQDHRQGDGESVFDTIGITVMDNQGRTVSSDLVANITDTTPEAQDDSVTQSAEDADVTVDVFADNGHGADTAGADGVDLETGVNLVPGSLNGTGNLVYNSNGTFTYTPGAGEEGTVTFKYTITDGDGDPSEAAVTITL
ncbi:MAG: retention module-containing protein, partial [Burkholderiales bacterium]|nr:retention module-containing protein [Burkholderiales bacterium]